MAASDVSGERKGDLDFAADLFKAADKMRGNVEPSEYKHISLGLIFLKYVSDAFEAQRKKLRKDDLADLEDPDEYLAANVFWLPPAARWAHLQAHAKSENIGKLIDDAMDAIEQVPSNGKLKGALPKGYARPALNKVMLGELIDLFSKIGMHDEFDRARDLFGRVYEYSLSSFAANEGKRGGEFLTPRSVVRTLLRFVGGRGEPSVSSPLPALSCSVMRCHRFRLRRLALQQLSRRRRWQFPRSPLRSSLPPLEPVQPTPLPSLLRVARLQRSMPPTAKPDPLKVRRPAPQTPPRQGRRWPTRLVLLRPSTRPPTWARHPPVRRPLA